MHEPPRIDVGGLLPLVTGLLWLGLGQAIHVAILIIALAPGLLLVTAGVVLLLWPGQRHVTHGLGLVSPASVVLAVLLVFWFGWASALLAIGGILCWLAAGLAALRQAIVPVGVSRPPLSLTVARKTAADEALLGLFVAFARIPRGAVIRQDLDEVEVLAGLSEQRGWRDAPEALHARPEAPRDFRLKRSRAHGCLFERIHYDSGYAPDDALPGVARWSGHRRNRRAGARIIRHEGGPRPWLICIHGYRMGTDLVDLSLFRTRRLHERLGLNVAMPILPLHGPRTAGRISGDRYLDGPMADLFHATTQGLWDLRRLIAWIRSQQPEAPIGVLGYSLGGYHAAGLAALEPDLACVIAGIPLTDIPATLWQHMPPAQRRYLEACGLSQTGLSDLMAPVSPLHLTPAIDHGRRYIFAATADQLVDPAQPQALWQHWDRPTMHWYHGSHLSVRRERTLGGFIDAALARHDLIAAGPDGA